MGDMASLPGYEQFARTTQKKRVLTRNFRKKEGPSHAFPHEYKRLVTVAIEDGNEGDGELRRKGAPG